MGVFASVHRISLVERRAVPIERRAGCLSAAGKGVQPPVKVHHQRHHSTTTNATTKPGTFLNTWTGGSRSRGLPRLTLAGRLRTMRCTLDTLINQLIKYINIISKQ